ncbi:MFS transporter [Kitasatospora cathayae]|uniref:MFS transporter n=1 Tax=Kitasatospora cathayae TaxID=3004092 RepID=A0ABY7QBM9_9ACTN|nr:MFS transporter [Kitasatospora sp. HUAS 3-15]WBP89936.1 MFS transporter [Kitasatospora sp. HUAS 3-15]
MNTFRGSGLLRNRDFSLLLSSQLISAIGDQAQFMALPLVVLALTGSATQAGFVLGLGTVSFLAFGLVAGALVDRWDRKTTMFWCEVGRTVLTSSVVVAAWLDRLTMPQLYATAVLAGFSGTVFQVASTAALPNIVDTPQLPTALGYQQSAASAVSIFGAPLAGALYAVGQVVPFAVNAVSFAVSAASLRLMRARFQVERHDVVRTRARLTTEIREGLSWLWREPVIRFLTLVTAADKARYGAGYLLIIALAQQLGSSSLWIGVIFSGAAVGAMVGALVSDRVTRRFRLGRIAVVMLWLEAVMFPLYALAPSPLLLAAVAAGESLVAPVYAVAMTTHQLSITPDELRGRATSTISTFTTGALSIGTLAGGALISALGAKPLVWLCGAWLLALALLTTANRAVRQAPRAGTIPRKETAIETRAAGLAS